MRLFLQQPGNPHLAVATLATPHHRPAPILDRHHGPRSDRVVDRPQDFRLGDLLATADQFPVIRILPDCLGLFLLRHQPERLGLLPFRDEGGVSLQSLPFLDHLHHHLRDRGGSGKARGLDADQVDGMRSLLVPDLDLEILDLSFLVNQFGEDARVGADIIAPCEMGPERHGALIEHVEILLLRPVVGEVIRCLGGGAKQDIPVGSTGNVDAHIGVARHGIDGHGHQIAQSVVEDDI